MAAASPPALLRVHVTPRASRNEVAGLREGVVAVRLTAPPVEGAANRACQEFLADRLGLKRSQVRLKSGAKSREKLFEVEGLTLPEALSRLGL